jgi:cytochrome c551/c552
MFLILIGIILLMQLIQPEKTNPPVDTTITLKAPKEVMQILKRACYDCHSYETIWPWYSNIAPLSWSIASHVKDGREAVNFSKWEEIQDEIKIKRLKRAIKTVNNGMMPLSSYLFLHPEATLSKEDKEVLIRWFDAYLKSKH